MHPIAAQAISPIHRGGFFMCDDFHGNDEWNAFLKDAPVSWDVLRAGLAGRNVLQNSRSHCIRIEGGAAVLRKACT